MSNERIEVGKLVLYPKRRRAEAAGTKIKLGGKQWEFLAILGHCAGMLVTREYLLACLHPDPQDRPNAHSVDMLAYIVRKKISDALEGENYIHPVACQGYVLRASP